MPDEGRQPRQRAVQQRTLDTRRKILDAAVEEFAALGYEGASTRTIAGEAGVKHTLVTYHFGGKEGLWRAAISSILTEYTESFQARLAGLRGVDAVTTLRLIQEEFIRFSAAKPQFHQIMAHVGQSPNPQLDWLIEQYLRHNFDGRAELIRQAQMAGRYAEGDPYHLEYVFIGAVTRIFMQSGEVEAIIGRSPFDPAFVDEHVRTCLSLFFRDPPPIRSSRRRNAKVQSPNGDAPAGAP